MKKVIIALICAFTALICVFLLCGCKTIRQTVEVPVYFHDTVRTVQVQHDSTYVDRWHTQYVKGDTVFVTDSHMYVTYRTRTDTIFKHIETPVEVTIEHTKEVAMPLTWLQRTLIYIGIGALVFVVLWVLWKVLLRRWLPTKLPTKNGN